MLNCSDKILMKKIERKKEKKERDGERKERRKKEKEGGREKEKEEGRKKGHISEITFPCLKRRKINTYRRILSIPSHA